MLKSKKREEQKMYFIIDESLQAVSRKEIQNTDKQYVAIIRTVIVLKWA